MYFFTGEPISSVLGDSGSQGQWQAQDVPQPPEAEPPEASPLDEVVLAGDSVDVAAVAAEAPPAALAALAAAPEPPRKSVAYQPEPLSWKPAAVTCLLKDSAPQAGQVVRGASDIF
jgi:hypothetical protein